MRNLKLVALSFVGIMLAGQTMAHGIKSTTAEQLVPAVMPTHWWQMFLPNAEAAAEMTIDESDGYRFFKSDSLPNHATGQFPGRGNPHTIKSLSRNYRVKLHPNKFKKITQVGKSQFGLALNGVLFDAETAEYWQNNRSWNYEALTSGLNLGIDSSNAHVQPDGMYHYHGIPKGLYMKGDYRNTPVLLGYAADGYPIYGPNGYADPNNSSSGLVKLKTSWHLKSGTRSGGPGGRPDGSYRSDWEHQAGSGDLDECNGRVGVTPEYPSGIYHYVITSEFPQIGRCWVGFPDSSFRRKSAPQTGGQPGGGKPGGGQRSGQGQQKGGQSDGPKGGPPRGGPPPEAIDACKSERDGAKCEFEGHRGPVRGSCKVGRSGRMECRPSHMR